MGPFHLGQAELAQPMNLTMITMNTQYMLRWSHDRHQTIGPKVSFTVQYLAKYKWTNGNHDQWITVCDKTPDTCCDLTPRNLYFLGLYMLRLRANSGRLHSQWVIKEFCPDKEAALGPPSKVDLGPSGAPCLDVKISDPLTSTNGSMKELHAQMYYRVVYWEQTDTRNPDTKIVDTRVNMLTLSDLQAWTSYCVSVQSRYDFYNKSSAFTTPHCMQTEGAVPWWQVMLIFFFSGLVGFVGLLLLLWVGVHIYRTVKDTFYPSVQLPAHFEAYLSDLSPGSDAPRLLTPDSESELICDRLSICPEAVLLEIHMSPLPSDLEPDGRHSRQESGGSGDSGVYSTEGSSGPRQHSGSGLSSACAKEPWHGESPALPEQVKMEHMGLKHDAAAAAHRGLRDEGIMDMGV
ncbi:Interferon alpha/beta receptor 1a [Merluccius polli]|uniref:Interferon alpha/beta receptor 1a n=1 Tax=Merluccius polli TaxID=89951 RepID=A0AA47N7T5_MERPO|nr:Interferon alpha/beta receptor 1a [Merluccius polli]